jgi:drug/metabolite transporter (DMT)-like permease
VKARGLAALVACALLWSTGGLFIKLVPWNPIAIAGSRSLIGGLLILAFLRRPRFTLSLTQILCGLSYAGCMILFVSATKLTTAANTILLQYTAPLYAAFLAAPLLGERTKPLDWITIAIVLGGMALFFLDKLSPGSTLGNLLAMASGVFFALTIVLLRKQKEGSPLESLLISHLVTFAISIPFLLAAPPAFSLSSAGGIAFLGLFQVGLPSILLSFGVRHVTAVQSLLTSFLEPILNPLWVFLALGEAPGAFALAGGAVILLTVTARSLITVFSESKPAGAAS